MLAFLRERFAKMSMKRGLRRGSLHRGAVMRLATHDCQYLSVLAKYLDYYSNPRRHDLASQVDKIPLCAPV